jgi:NADPH2:quinone reductase
MRAAYAEHGQIIIKDVAEPTPGPGQLLVEVKAAGLNAADRLIVNGSYVRGSSTRHAETSEAPSIALGAEAAGEVVAIGEGVSGFAVGDRVMGVSGSAFAPFTLLGAALAMHVPERLSFTEAAAVPTTFTTAHDALLSAGRMEKGVNVLVTAAPSGVGIAALQLARFFGAGVVGASSRSATKLEALANAGMPMDIGIVADDPGFVDTALAATDDHGFDVVIDNVGGPALQTNVAVSALRGRIVSVGRMGGNEGTFDLDELARKRVSLVGVSFRTRPVEEIVEVHRRAGEDIVPALAAGHLQVIVDRSFPFDEILAAQDWMQTGRQLGKVVLTFD